MSAQVKNNWPVAAPPPTLSNNQWYASSLVGIIFVAAAFLQIINFQDFSNNFGTMGLSDANWWAGVVVFAEIWAAAGFFKIRLSWLFRVFSNYLAILAIVFWVFETLRQFSDYYGVNSVKYGLDHSLIANFFGKYLTQPIGWWPVVEVAVFTFLVLYCLEQFGSKTTARAQAVTKVTRRSGKKEIQNV